MDSAHLHLMLNHFPIAGMVFAIPLLLIAIFKRNNVVAMIGMLFVVLSGLATIPTFFTGEPAEEILEMMPGISEQLIKVHEEAAEKVIWLVGATALIALISLIIAFRKGGLPKRSVGFVTILAIGSIGLLAWTNNLGGLISHPEIRKNRSSTTEVPTKTIHNLNAAIIHEANESNRYRIFAVKADADNYPQVAKLFRAIAESEDIHRRNHEAAIKQLGGTIEGFELMPVKAASTAENLRSRPSDEKQQYATTYPEYIKQARTDHATEALESFISARDAELQHSVLLNQALNDLGKNRKMDYFVNKKSGSTVQRKPGSSTPEPEQPSGEYRKVE